MFELTRANRSPLAQWWWTVDRVLAAALLLLALTGIVFSMAASPSVALKLGLSEFHFVKRQLVFLGLGLAIMLSVSLLDPRRMRRVRSLPASSHITCKSSRIASASGLRGASRLKPSALATPG